jgi:hypothetical protein
MGDMPMLRQQPQPAAFHRKEISISTCIFVSIGSVPQVAGVNFHCRTASIASLSTSFPADWTTAGLLTLPFLSTVSSSRVMALFGPFLSQLAGGDAGGLNTTLGSLQGGFCGDSCLAGVGDWSSDAWPKAEQTTPRTIAQNVTMTIRIRRSVTRRRCGEATIIPAKSMLLEESTDENRRFHVLTAGR